MTYEGYVDEMSDHFNIMFIELMSHRKSSATNFSKEFNFGASFNNNFVRILESPFYQELPSSLKSKVLLEVTRSTRSHYYHLFNEFSINRDKKFPEEQASKIVANLSCLLA